MRESFTAASNVTDVTAQEEDRHVDRTFYKLGKRKSTSFWRTHPLSIRISDVKPAGYLFRQLCSLSETANICSAERWGNEYCRSLSLHFFLSSFNQLCITVTFIYQHIISLLLSSHPSPSFSYFLSNHRQGNSVCILACRAVHVSEVVGGFCLAPIMLATVLWRVHRHHKQEVETCLHHT